MSEDANRQAQDHVLASVQSIAAIEVQQTRLKGHLKALARLLEGTTDPIEAESPTEEQQRYTVTVNAEEQYAFWPVDKPLPLGWKSAGKEGTKQECVTYIAEVWTDMRPLSQRQAQAPSVAEPSSSLELSPDYLGTVILWAGTNIIPEGWASCEGQLIPLSQNTLLFSILGTTYGGDGRTTFALPDLRKHQPLPQMRYLICFKGRFPQGT